MARFGVVGRPPAFRHHLTVPHDHEAVQRVDLVRFNDEIANGLGRNALRLGRAARQGQAGGTRANSGRKKDAEGESGDKRAVFHAGMMAGEG